MVMVAKSSLYSNSISSYGMSFFPFSLSAKYYFLTYTTHTSFTSHCTIRQVTERPQPEQVANSTCRFKWYQRKRELFVFSASAHPNVAIATIHVWWSAYGKTRKRTPLLDSQRRVVICVSQLCWW